MFAAAGLRPFAEMAFVPSAARAPAAPTGLGRPPRKHSKCYMSLFGGVLDRIIFTIVLLITLGTTVISCGEENCECPAPEAIEYTTVLLYCKEHPDCVSQQYDLIVHLSVDDEYLDTWESFVGSADPNSEYPVSIPFQVKKNSIMGVSFSYENKSFQIRYDGFEIPLDAMYCTYISFFAGTSDPCQGNETCDSCLVYDIDDRMLCDGADSIFVTWYAR